MNEDCKTPSGDEHCKTPSGDVQTPETSGNLSGNELWKKHRAALCILAGGMNPWVLERLRAFSVYLRVYIFCAE